MDLLLPYNKQKMHPYHHSMRQMLAYLISLLFKIKNPEELFFEVALHPSLPSLYHRRIVIAFTQAGLLTLGSTSATFPSVDSGYLALSPIQRRERSSFTGFPILPDFSSGHLCNLFNYIKNLKINQQTFSDICFLINL